MKIKYSYSTVQLKKAVEFISKNNPDFSGKDTFIKDTILNLMQQMLENFPNSSYVGTMGILINAEDLEQEKSIDGEVNYVHFEIYVDPAVSFNRDILTEEFEL